MILFATASSSQELKIGLSAEPSAMDPHYHNLTPNNSILSHVFERLIATDDKQRLMPGLAESWKVVGDTVWEFKLRQRREMARRLTVHGRRRGVHLPARTQRAQQSIELRGRRQGQDGHQGRRSHSSHQHRGRGADPAQRRRHHHDRVEEAWRRRQDRGLQLRQGGDRHRGLQVREVHARRSHRVRAQRRLLGARSPSGRNCSSSRSRPDPRALPPCSPATST